MPTKLRGTVGPGIVIIENAGGDLVWKNEGRVAEIVDPATQTILHPGESLVQSDGAGPRLTDDRTSELSASFANLAALVADGTDGDGFFSGGAFTAGQFVVLADYSTASYDGANWAEGVA